MQVLLPNTSNSIQHHSFVCTQLNKYWPICQVGRVFANGPGDQDSMPGQVIPKTQKMVLDTSLLNPQHYKVCIKDKMEQFRERSCTLLNTSSLTIRWFSIIVEIFVDSGVLPLQRCSWCILQSQPTGLLWREMAQATYVLGHCTP